MFLQRIFPISELWTIGEDDQAKTLENDMWLSVYDLKCTVKITPSKYH